MKITKEVWTLALGIALLPPIWAALSPYIGITTGAVALICAGLYVTNGNKVEDAVKISLGFLCGDIWAVLALFIMEKLALPESLELFITLFVLGGAAVLIASALARFIFLPAWLCGWAIGLTIMGAGGFGGIGSLPVQIAVAMLVGVWYVGAGVDKFQRILLNRHRKEDEK